jgi:hypothetical protein
MELPPQAARALEAVRRKAQSVRFEIKKACEQERWRLKVVYVAADAGTGHLVETQLGLLWSDDLAGLKELQSRLETGGTSHP